MSDLKIKDLVPKTKKKKININPRLPQPPFFWAISAPRGSGKSNLIINLFRKGFYKKIFRPDDIFLITPSLGLDNSVEAIPATNKFSEYNPEILEQIMDQQKKIKRSKGEQAMPNVLIIFDDNITEATFSRNGILELIGYRGRHYNVSAIFTTQKYSALSRGIRMNCTYCTFFKPVNNSEMDHIIDEHSDKTNKKRFLNMFKSATEKKYDFLHIDYEADEDKRYQQNFDEYLYINDFSDE